MGDDSADSTRRKPRIWRDNCVALDVVRLAREGFFHPGIHSGRAELPVISDDVSPVSLEIWAQIGPENGVLRVDWPVPQTIPVVLVASGIGFQWRLVCTPCGTYRRQLLVPETPPGVLACWACGACWGVRYRGPGDRAAAREDRMESLEQMERDIATLKRVMLMDRFDP